MELLFAGSLVVFAITLVVTKADILACKREFVTKRYEASFVGGQQPSFIHKWFYKMFTCPMCLGAWVSLVVAPWFCAFGYIFDVAILFSLNWLIHCIENCLFQVGNFYEKSSSKKDEST